jgi:phosphatidylinositol 4-kinase B
LFKIILDDEHTGIKICSYEIILTGQESGWIDYLADTISLDAMKKKYKCESMENIYKKVFADNFEEAKKNFVQSLAGGS